MIAVIVGIMMYVVAVLLRKRAEKGITGENSTCHREKRSNGER